VYTCKWENKRRGNRNVFMGTINKSMRHRFLFKSDFPKNWFSCLCLAQKQFLHQSYAYRNWMSWWLILSAKNWKRTLCGYLFLVHLFLPLLSFFLSTITDACLFKVCFCEFCSSVHRHRNVSIGVLCYELWGVHNVILQCKTCICLYRCIDEENTSFLLQRVSFWSLET